MTARMAIYVAAAAKERGLAELPGEVLGLPVAERMLAIGRALGDANGVHGQAGGRCVDARVHGLGQDAEVAAREADRDLQEREADRREQRRHRGAPRA